MKIICDTHVMIFWADGGSRLSKRASRLIDENIADGNLACADISLWEIAQLCRLGRLTPKTSADSYISDIITAMNLSVLHISPEIAFISQKNLFEHKDPADRLIAATAISHNSKLITKDEKLQRISSLKTIW